MMRLMLIVLMTVPVFANAGIEKLTCEAFDKLGEQNQKMIAVGMLSGILSNVIAAGKFARVSEKEDYFVHLERSNTLMIKGVSRLSPERIRYRVLDGCTTGDKTKKNVTSILTGIIINSVIDAIDNPKEKK